MASKKYLNDYRVHEQIDSRGRVRSEVVYIGGDYVVLPKIPKNARRLMLIICVLLWPCLIGALIFPTRASYLTYVVLPYIFSALPLYLACGAAFSFYKAGDILTRRDAERITKRLPPNALAVAALSGISFLALAVSAVFSFDAMLPGDAVFGAMALAITVGAAYIYIKCRNIKAQLIEKP